MKKILQITSQLARNGTETFIMNVYKNIDRTLFSFDFLIFTNDDGGYCEEAESMGATIYRIPIKRNQPFKRFKALNNFFKTKSGVYDAIHFNGTSLTSIDIFYFAKYYKIPIRIAHSHGSKTVGLHNIILHNINKHILPFVATDFLACSQVAARWAYHHTLSQKKYRVINNGINLEKYFFNSDTRKQKRAELQLNNQLAIGTIGRLVEVKNHLFLLDVFYEAHKKNPSTVLFIVGDGELRDVIIDKINRLGLTQSVRLLGLRTDIPDILQAFDLFVLPSLYEGLPFVMVEAQAAGLPCVVSDTISKEVDLSGNVQFIPLADTEQWQNSLVTKPEVNREAVQSSVPLEDYNIKTTVKLLGNIYTRENNT